MKKLLTILFLAASIAVSGQTVPGYVRPGLFYGVEYYRGKFDSAFGLPRKTSLRLNTTDNGPQVFILNDTAFVWYANGVYHVLGQNGVQTQILDTSSLSNRINQRVQYVDTAAMLNPYLKKTVADASYYPLLTNPAGYSVLPNVINSLQVINGGAATSIQAGTYAARPSAGITGRSYIATDSAAYYYDNGTSWVRLGGSSSGGAGLSYPLSPKRYLNGYGNFPQLNTDSIFEGLNLFFTNTRARAAVSLTTTGTGAATYNNTTGVFNIPIAAGSLTNVGGGYPNAYLGTSNVKSWYFSGLINDTSAHANANTLRVDSGLYSTHRYIDSILRSYAGVADTFVLAGQGAGQTLVYGNQTDTLKTKRLGNGLWTKSATNTDSSARIDIDSTFVPSRNWTLDAIARYSGGGTGPSGPDTITLNYIDAGIQLLKAKDSILQNRTVINGYGTRADTAGTGGLRINQDTVRVKASEIGSGIVLNDSTVDNAPTITAAILLAYNLGKHTVELPDGSINIKSNWTPKSGVWLASAGSGTTIRGNFTSDHYLFNYNSATPLNDIGFEGITWDRRGPNVSHGWMGGNVHYVHFIRNRFIDNDTTAAGGALGISAFSPWATYPSDHIYVDDCDFIGSGNFAVQVGNGDWIYVRRAHGFRNYREFVSPEPYNLGGENGKVRHFFAEDCINYNPDNTVVNGSATGVYIVTNSSGGAMDDINYTNCVDSGGSQSSMHGWQILGGNNVTLTNCRSVYTGGYGFYVTSSAYGESRNVRFINCYARNNGRDGTRNAGLRVHDTQLSNFDITSDGNTYGFIEDGTSQLNKFSGNVSNNTNPYSLNTGRPHFSVLRDLISDSVSYGKTSILAYLDSVQGSRIVASRGTKYPALLDIKTGDSLYLNKNDTNAYNLESAMQNSSLLTHAHLVQGPAITWGNGINTFASGIKFGTASTTTSGQGQLYVVTATAGHDSLYYNSTAGPFNLMRGGGLGSLDPYIGRHVTPDSLYYVEEHASGKWDSTAFTGFGGSSGGGGGGGGSSYYVDRPTMTPISSGAGVGYSSSANQVLMTLPDLTSIAGDNPLNIQPQGTDQMIVIFNRNANATYHWKYDASVCTFYSNTGANISGNNIPNSTTVTFYYIGQVSGKYIFNQQ
jgi:hypothetical protein